MGLDNFVSRVPGDVVLTLDDELAFIASGIGLCGGMHSDGVTSFRGKVYATFVTEVTGESLFEEWLAPETVARMADSLAACDPDTAHERPDLDSDFVPSPGEIRDLQTLFRICADLGLGIIAWA
jgi:hypothetical protein